MKRCLLIVASLLLAHRGQASANPLSMFGAGARGAAMGGAHTAGARDGSANFYNPALLATLSTLEIDMSYRLARFDLRLNGKDLGVDVARGTHFSVVVPGRIAGTVVATGVSAYVPDQQLMRIRSLSERQPRFALYDNRAQRLYINVNFGVALGEKFSVGGGLAYLAATSGGVTLEGRVGFPDANDSELVLDMDVDITSNAYPVGGIAYQIRPWLRLAAAFRGEVQPITDLGIDILGDIGAEGREPIVSDAAVNLRSVSLSHFQPAEFSVGAEAWLGESLVVVADLGYVRWSRFANPASNLESALELGQFNEFLTPPAAASLAEVNYHDVLIPRIGAEWRASDGPHVTVHTRAGYSYEPSPAPEQIGLTNFVDNDKHTLSAGLGLSLEDWSGVFLEPLSVDLSLAATTLAGRDHRKLSPVDPVGDYHSDGTVWQAIVTSRLRF
ncbi:MAG: hypothetical protein GY811_00605 [Myxococcales bacterium]|nr:hypothetical protein [Myxococcales bacterium]